MNPQHADTIADVIAKAAPAPPIAVLCANLAGITLPDVVNILTIAYVSVLLANKLWQIFDEWREKSRRNYRRRSDDES